MVIGVILSLGLLIRHLNRPHSAALGRRAGSDDEFVDVAEHVDAAPVPGVLIHRFEAPLVFANSEVFTDDVLARVAAADPPHAAVILDFGAVSDVDSTGSAALADMKRTLAGRGVQLLLAHPTGSVRRLMSLDGVVAAVGEDNVFATVRAAVAALEGPDGSSPATGGGRVTTA